MRCDDGAPSSSAVEDEWTVEVSMRCVVRKLKVNVYLQSQYLCEAIFVRESEVSDPWRSPEKKCEDGYLKVSAFWPELAVGKAPVAFWGRDIGAC